MTNQLIKILEEIEEFRQIPTQEEYRNKWLEYLSQAENVDSEAVPWLVGEFVRQEIQEFDTTSDTLSLLQGMVEVVESKIGIVRNDMSLEGSIGYEKAVLDLRSILTEAINNLKK